MSKFSSYDDLPLDVAYELQRLEHELQEGDITQKGYDKKKANILAPYKDTIGPKMSYTKIQQDPDMEASVEDLGPEPSAADVQDFLDFLPSPTNSPVDRKGATLMEENHKHMIKGGPSNNNLPPPPSPYPPASPYPPPSPFPPQASLPSQTPFHARSPALAPAPLPHLHQQQYQQQQHNWTPNNNNNNFRPFDHRMGPVRPMQGFPIRPHPMNGHRPLPAQSGVPPSPMFRPFRPPPIPAHHTRSPSLESSSEYGIPFGVRQSLDSVAAEPNWGNNNKTFSSYT